MSFFVFPIECCYLVVEATEINGYYTNLIISITEVIQYEQEYNRLMNLTASDSLWTWKLLNDVKFEHQMQTYKNCELEDYWEWACNFEQKRKYVKRRVRKSPQLEIGDKVLYILSQIQANDLHFGYFMRKAPEKDRNYTLKRSSKYIGVSMNGNNWQTMINNGFGKKYIGTYSTEKRSSHRLRLLFVCTPRLKSSNKLWL